METYFLSFTDGEEEMFLNLNHTTALKVKAVDRGDNTVYKINATVGNTQHRFSNIEGPIVVVAAGDLFFQD